MFPRILGPVADRARQKTLSLLTDQRGQAVRATPAVCRNLCDSRHRSLPRYSLRRLRAASRCAGRSWRHAHAASQCSAGCLVLLRPVSLIPDVFRSRHGQIRSLLHEQKWPAGPVQPPPFHPRRPAIATVFRESDLLPAAYTVLGGIRFVRAFWRFATFLRAPAADGPPVVPGTGGIQVARISA